MFDSRVRGSGASRFVPQLESLEGRANPGGVFPSAAGFGTVVEAAHIGDEIPQLPGVARAGTSVDLYGSKPSVIRVFDADELTNAGSVSLYGSKPGVGGTNAEALTEIASGVHADGSKPSVISG